MTHLGRRKKVEFPRAYGGFRLLPAYGRVFAVPPPFDPKGMLADGTLFTHPAVLSASNLAEVRALVDRADPAAHRPEFVGGYEGYDLFRHRGSFHGVPRSAGPVDLDLPEECARAGVITGPTRAEVEARVRGLRDAAPVEFAGWLPIFGFFGNCGRHPQFTHRAEPPPGYRFTCSEPPPRRPRPGWFEPVARLRQRAGHALRRLPRLVAPFFALFRGGRRVSLRTRLRVLAAIVRLFVLFLRRGARPGAALRFLQTRHLQSQLLLPPDRGLVFLTSMPYTYGQDPWVIEVEDPTTLFYPFIHNGHTYDLDIHESPYFPVVKALLESESCKGILTHVRSTAEMLPTLFRSETIRRKVFYAPLGVPLPARWQRHPARPADEPIHLLFINSWCQIPTNLYVRGGLDVLEAFATLRQRYPQLRLTLRTSLPTLDDHYHRIIEQGGVRVIHRFLPAREMADLHADSHIFLLPAARIHVVSLLQAMSYGLAVVTSDGWGIEEYVEHGRNGLIVKGRYGKTSWADHEAGMLREDYEPTYTPDPEVVQGLVEAVSRLVEDRALRARLGRAARADVETKYNMGQWNRALQEAFDRARGVDPHPAGFAGAWPSNERGGAAAGRRGALAP
jgi:glycosyltransferase involved in cell wall biosynthesis